MIATSAAVESYLYTGQEDVPRDITHLTVAPAVTEIPPRKFVGYYCLLEVIFQGELVFIGEEAFYNCHNLKRINIPSTVTHIGPCAFTNCYRMLPPTLPEGLETIGAEAFGDCTNFRNFRIPSSVEGIGKASFRECAEMLSLEISQDIVIRDCAFHNCNRLRNIAIPSPDAKVATSAFHRCDDLNQVFRDGDSLIDALKSRFERWTTVSSGLVVYRVSQYWPIHKVCYYHSHHSTETTIRNLQHAITSYDNDDRQDCLGMTPLHILSLSTKQDLKFYQMLVERFPEDLVTKDFWGDLPIHYACMVNAPAEIIDFLLNSHKARFPYHELDWEKMITNDGNLVHVCMETAMYLLVSQKDDFPDQMVNFKEFLEQWNEDLTLELLQLLVDHQVDAFPDLVVDWQRILVDKILMGKSTKKMEMVKYLLDTQTTYFPDQSVNFKEFLEQWNEGLTLELLQLLVDHQMDAFPDLVLDWETILVDMVLRAPFSHATKKFEMVQYLLNVKNAHFPNHKVDFKEFLEAEREYCIDLETLQLLISNQMESFPDETLDWKKVTYACLGDTSEVVRFVVQASIAKRMEGMGSKEWGPAIESLIDAIPDDKRDQKIIINSIDAKLAKYELQEAASLLELGLWKGELERVSPKAVAIENEFQQGGKGGGRKKRRTNHLDPREKCHVNCGAGIVIRNVLPFLDDDHQDSGYFSDSSSYSSDSSHYDY